jgi:hypothetical protein
MLVDNFVVLGIEVVVVVVDIEVEVVVVVVVDIEVEVEVEAEADIEVEKVVEADKFDFVGTILVVISFDFQVVVDAAAYAVTIVYSHILMVLVDSLEFVVHFEFFV